jgi:hypothetical protein
MLTQIFIVEQITEERPFLGKKFLSPLRAPVLDAR